MNARLDQGHEALKNAEVLSTKIGGENATKFHQNLARIRERAAHGKAQIIGVSALRTSSFNTTDRLLEMVAQLEQSNFAEASIVLESIKQFHRQMIKMNVELEVQAVLLDLVDREFSSFTYLLRGLEEDGAELQNLGVDYIFTDKGGTHHSLTGFGEVLCQKLYHAYLGHHGFKVSSLPREGIIARLYIDGPQAAYEKKVDIQAALRREFSTAIGKNLEAAGSLVQVDAGHQGFLGLRRGYTDAEVAEAARAAASHGPRVVFNEEKTTPIRTAARGKVVPVMSRNMLAELTGTRGAEAKVIHPNVAGILKDTTVDMVVHDPDRPELGSTFIPHEGGLELDDLEMVMSKKTKTVLTIDGDMSGRKGVLAAITKFLRVKNIDQTFSMPNAAILTLDKEVTDMEIEALEGLLSSQFGTDFHVRSNENFGLVFALAGSQRHHPHSTDEERIHYANQIAEPPFAATVLEGGDKGVAVPFAFTIEGPMSDSPGVLAVITDVLKDNYSIEHTFSTETTWTITLDQAVTVADQVRLHRALDAEFGNGWTFEKRTDLRVVTEDSPVQYVHPLWALLQQNGIQTHYMHAIPGRGVTVLMIPQDQLLNAEQIIHTHFHGA